MSCGCRDGRGTDGFPVFRRSLGRRHVPAQDASELLGIARELPRWDALIIVAENDNYPSGCTSRGTTVTASSSTASRTGSPWGFFLATTTSFSSPEIEIEMGGQALEKWPRQLFVDPRLRRSSRLLPEDRKTERNAALGPNRRFSSRNRVGNARGSRGVGTGGSNHEDEACDTLRSPSEEGLTAQRSPTTGGASGRRQVVNGRSPVSGSARSAFSVFHTSVSVARHPTRS